MPQPAFDLGDPNFPLLYDVRLMASTRAGTSRSLLQANRSLDDQTAHHIVNSKWGEARDRAILRRRHLYRWACYDGH